MSELFRCKHFTVKQSNKVFKVNTDGLLLGAWIRLEENDRVLDVGTGTGIISLCIMQRFPSAIITAIDSNSYASNLAHENFTYSTWNNSLLVRNLTLSQLIDKDHTIEFEHIVSNPPFFSDGLLPESEILRVSKHQEGLTMRALCEAANKITGPKGKLSLVIPVEQYERSEELIQHLGLCVLRKTLFLSKKNRPVRFLLTLSKTATKTEESSIIMYNQDGTYHDDYRILMEDFLTIF